MDFSPPIPTGTTELTGTVRQIIWSNWNDNSETDRLRVIARIAPSESDGQEIAVAGPCPRDGIEPGMAFRFLGRWTKHHRYGDQFSFSTFTRSEPAGRAGVIRYLVKLASNIGEAKAAQLWDKFGADAVKVLRLEPVRISQSGILSLEQANEAAADLEKYAALEETRIGLFSLFDRRGFPGQIIESCIAKWGARSAELIRRNPFILMTSRPRLPGAGFRRCDRLYRDLGKNPARLKRQMLAAWHALRTEANGHTWMHFSAVRELALRYISEDGRNFARALQLGIRSRWLALYTDRADDERSQWIAENAGARNEAGIASQIVMLRQTDPKWKDAATEIVEGAISDHQRATLALALRESVGILAGTPGTGKTFTAAQIVKYLSCRYNLESIAVCAPTGKAAVRCSDAMVRYGLDLQAKTIHRTLEVTRNGHDGDGWGFVHTRHFPLPYQFIIVDESSMLDTDLAFALFDACAPGTHVLLIGDPYQLPPVGHGAPLRDLMAAGIPCGELTEIRRNSGMIVEACSSIKAGETFAVADKYLPDEGRNLRHLHAVDADDAIDLLKTLLTTFRERKLFDPVWDVQVLCTVNSKSKLSRAMLNRALQAELNPAGATEKHHPFRVGDKIICVKNNLFTVAALKSGRAGTEADDYQDTLSETFVANGDIGRVLAVGPKVAIAKFFTPDRIIRIYVGKAVQTSEADSGGHFAPHDDQSTESESERTGTGCDFSLAYAITTHKAQGSEWPVAIVMIDETAGAKRVCCREHVYTAISRAKQLCVTIGKISALYGLCRKVTLIKRKTFLREILTEAMQESTPQTSNEAETEQEANDAQSQ